jgi:molecular chaperone DnaK (HSP70)
MLWTSYHSNLIEIKNWRQRAGSSQKAWCSWRQALDSRQQASEVRAESKNADTPKGQSTQQRQAPQTIYAKSKASLHGSAEADLGSKHDEAAFTVPRGLPFPEAKRYL